jgi:hypothetical protein
LRRPSRPCLVTSMAFVLSQFTSTRIGNEEWKSPDERTAATCNTQHTITWHKYLQQTADNR